MRGGGSLQMDLQLSCYLALTHRIFSARNRISKYNAEQRQVVCRTASTFASINDSVNWLLAFDEMDFF
jgi:hypothetical protein